MQPLVSEFFKALGLQRVWSTVGNLASLMEPRHLQILMEHCTEHDISLMIVEVVQQVESTVDQCDWVKPRFDSSVLAKSHSSRSQLAILVLQDIGTPVEEFAFFYAWSTFAWVFHPRVLDIVMSPIRNIKMLMKQHHVFVKKPASNLQPTKLNCFHTKKCQAWHVSNFHAQVQELKASFPTLNWTQKKGATQKESASAQPVIVQLALILHFVFDVQERQVYQGGLCLATSLKTKKDSRNHNRSTLAITLTVGLDRNTFNYRKVIFSSMSYSTADSSLSENVITLTSL